MATNLPFNGNFKVTCEYRKKGNTWKAKFHTGIDLVGITSHDIYSVCDGTVTMVSSLYGAYGKAIKIKNSDGNIFLFAHLSKIYVKKGQKVSRTTKIGVMGNTGNSSAPHLHIEMRTPTDVYGQVLDIADYMKIPNKKGQYNSENYQIINKKYKVGQKVTVDIPVAFTGAIANNKILVDSNGYQFWIDKSVVINYARIYGKAEIIKDYDNGIYRMKMLTEEFDCREQYFK